MAGNPRAELLPKSVLTSWTLALLLGTAVAAHPAHTQTEWQRQLFKKVEESAAKLSEAATPQLLERLDSAAFRAQLSNCCPSASDLSAAELLRRLQGQVGVTEVVSGFPAVSSDARGPDSPGMSIADGLTGSFFQNDWQMVLLHSKDPDSVFHHVEEEYAKATLDPERAEVTLQQWSSGCTAARHHGKAYPLNKCLRDPADESVIMWVLKGSHVIELGWMSEKQRLTGLRRGAKLRRVHRRDRHTRLTELSNETACTPRGQPDWVEYYIADGTCHSYTRYNASDGWQMEDNAEMRQYGLKPFKVRGAPKTLAEAAERGPYSMVNNYLIDQGSPMYGDVSAVFSTSVMRDLAIVSAVDTGFYENSCTGTKLKMFGSLNFNCSASTPFKLLGTMEHFNHLFLINEDFWNGSSTLVAHFKRLEGPWGSQPVVGYDFLRYWEAVPAGMLRYPEAVRFLIGSFPSLFGSAQGERLRNWARQRGWVLVWSLGPNVGDEGDRDFNFGLMMGNRSFAMNQRLLDPEVMMHTTAAASLPIGGKAVDSFQKLWAEVAMLRILSMDISNVTMAQHWRKLASDLPDLLVQPLRFGDCDQPPSAPECIGKSLGGHCVCYSEAAARDEAAVVV